MSFKLEETTIRDVHEGYLSGQLTCVRLVQAYLDRISAYDQSGPTLNTFVKLNPAALEEAAALDAHLAASGTLLGPLHGILVAVKDQAETRASRRASDARRCRAMCPNRTPPSSPR
jgi:amidase